MTPTPDFPELAAIRLGYGLSPSMPPPPDAGAVLASVARAAIPDGWTTQAAADAQRTYAQAQRMRRDGDMSDAAFRDAVGDINRQRIQTLLVRLARASAAPVGFGERLVQFWADHFAVVAQGTPQHLMAAAMVDEAIRPHIAGRFADMMMAAETHPMMLRFLNQTESFGPNSVYVRKRPERALGLNENLAREALELHSLGVGSGYTQRDVRELAELLTGLTYWPASEVRFIPQAAEPGAETVLGETYGGPGTGGLDEIRRAFGDLSRRPETARHLARKLAIHFAADDPPADLVAALEGAWLDSDGDLARVNAVLVSHPNLASTFRGKVRQPFEFLATALRALDVAPARILAFVGPELNQTVVNPMSVMGQRWNRPRGPDGWPEAAEAWITPQMLSARIAWALRLPGRLVDPLPDPREFLRTTLGDTASEALRVSVPRAESAREGVAIVLASADFNRR